jgi:hypothetical protein
MHEDSDRRLARHSMLPILIENELDQTVDNGQDLLIETIRRRLQMLLDVPKSPSKELVVSLLRYKRLLIVIDRLSELGDTTRKHIRLENPDFPINALLVTSRIEEKLGGYTPIKISPLRVTGNRLSSFMEAYLVKTKKRQLFVDSEFFDACKRLSAMVGERQITVLLAKLYAEQIVARKESDQTEAESESIPDVFLNYINILNRSIESDRRDDRSVQDDAKLVAWQCLKDSLQPSATDISETLERLGGDTAEVRLTYLADKLRVIQLIRPGLHRIRFLLDPLAEYLAAIWLVEHCAQDSVSRNYS